MGSRTIKTLKPLLAIVAIVAAIKLMNWFTYEPGVECWIINYRTCFDESPMHQLLHKVGL